MKHDSAAEKASTPPATDRCPSGVEGLDDILAGGLPCGCFYLIQGDPGSGKTTLAMQFLLEGLRRGESAFYVTLSETRQELVKVARSHGWSLEGIPLLELSAIEQLLRPEAQTTVFHPSEVELIKVSKLMMDEAEKARPARVVFDSLSEFRLMAETALRYRRQLLSLKQQFARLKSTVLLLDDKMDKSGTGVDPHVLSLSHGVIEMEQLSPDYGISRRRLRVVKLRGVKFREGYHDYLIETGGLRIFPSAFQTIVNLIDHAMAAQDAVEAPRIWTEGGPLELEPAYSAETAAALERRGHAILRVPHVAGGMNAISFAPDGLMTGAACWRADGTPVGIAGGLARPGVRFALA